QVYTFWRGGGINTGSSNVTELNYHRVGDRLAWSGDQFTIPGESRPYAGNVNPERAQILGSIYALSVLHSAGAQLPLPGLPGLTDPAGANSAPAGGALPPTGTSGGLAVTSTALVLVGLGLVAVRRQRRRLAVEQLG
ncbi:MAG: hypothetical protein LBH68_01960, partial [Bifidobacteriaceae bacterium]|nr:hypothetical protein [Bifidobacteriaceae bacterium]